MGRFLTSSPYLDLFERSSQDRMRRFFLADLAPLGVLREYPKGSSVDHQRMGRSMGVVVRGCLSKAMVSYGGRDKLLYFLRPGEIFGEMDLIDGGAFPYTLFARERSLVSFVPAAEVDRVLLERPEAHKFFVHSMTRKFRIVALQLANSVFNQAKGQVAEALLRLHACSDPSESQEVCIRVTQQELASNIGCSRVTVARALKELLEEGVINRRGRELLIVDMEALISLRDGVR